jgi:integrase
VPKPLRFHDTRHSAATLLLKEKISLAIVQRVMRHSDPTITSNVYGNLGVEDLREAVNMLGDRVKPHLKLLPANRLIEGGGEPESTR